MTAFSRLDQEAITLWQREEALKKHAGESMSASEIARAALETAGEICVYTNDQIILEEP